MRTELSWDFLKHFLCEVAAGNALIELDKLDNVTLYGSSTVISEDTVVAIKLLHLTEISIADAHDDD